MIYKNPFLESNSNNNKKKGNQAQLQKIQKTHSLKPHNTNETQNDHIKQKQAYLLESKARTRIGGTILKTRAFSRNFQATGTLLSQQMCETKRVAS